MKILVTGGAGYVGSLLTKRLSEKNHEVLIYDMCWFGKDHINENINLKLIQADIRDKVSFERAVKNVDVVIHLACISNDPSYDLNENLSKTINYDCFKDLVETSKKNKVKKFIYASSSSVYGYSDDPNVTEEHPLVPLTLYNKFKGLCEPILQDYLDDSFTGVIIRPATVCGYAPHCRLDLSVNILTNHAVNNKKITVFGGEQLRPNLHIQDYCDVVKLLINADSKKISNQIFNVGYQNMSINEIAKVVKKTVQEEFPEYGEIPIIKTQSNDNRSYHINSDKIKETLGYQAKRSVEDAVRELSKKFKEKLFNNTLENDFYYNIKRMKNLKAS